MKDKPTNLQKRMAAKIQEDIIRAQDIRRTKKGQALAIEVSVTQAAKRLADADNIVQAEFFNEFFTALYAACGGKSGAAKQLLHVVDELTDDTKELTLSLSRELVRVLQERDEQYKPSLKKG
jgi:hypothetical protein